jgi:hypothetical protein
MKWLDNLLGKAAGPGFIAAAGDGDPVAEVVGGIGELLGAFTDTEGTPPRGPGFKPPPEFFTTHHDALNGWDGETVKGHAAAICHTSELAVAAYIDDDDAFEAAAREGGYSGGVIVRGGRFSSAEVAVVWSEQWIGVAPRGSESIGDWFNDLLSLIPVKWRVLKSQGERERIGWGFRRQADQIGPLVLGQVQDAQEAYPDAKIFVSGHSLGGALAWLLTRFLWCQAVYPEFVIAHESPRVGNAEFARWFDRPGAGLSEIFPAAMLVVCVEDGKEDIVTRVPPRRWAWPLSWLFGARKHCGQKVVISDIGIFKGNAEWREHQRRHPVTSRYAAWRVVSNGFSALWSSGKAHLSARGRDKWRVRARAESRERTFTTSEGREA